MSSEFANNVAREKVKLTKRKSREQAIAKLICGIENKNFL